MKDIYYSNRISVVVDNNVLIDLFELDCLSLLFSCFDQVTIPKIIYDEETPLQIKTILAQFPFVLGIITTSTGQEVYAQLINDFDFKRLSMHDRFAIAIAKENTYYCNSNDRLIRRACEKLDVKFTGILGVLGRAYVQGFIRYSQLMGFLDKLTSEDTSCYIDLQVVEEFKQEMSDIRDKTTNNLE